MNVLIITLVDLGHSLVYPCDVAQMKMNVKTGIDQKTAYNAMRRDLSAPCRKKRKTWKENQSVISINRIRIRNRMRPTLSDVIPNVPFRFLLDARATFLSDHILDTFDDMKSMLITGASTGIGYVTAEYFLQRGWKVIGSVRKEEDGQELRSRYEHYLPVLFDVTDNAAVRSAVHDVEQFLNGGTLNMLVNNAGIAVYGPLMHLPIEEMEHQFSVNLIGVLRVTQAFLPLVGARDEHKGEKGRVVNVGSVSGRFTTPLLGPYCASKHALEAFSDALRREMMIYDIPVSLVQPSATISDIWTKAKTAESYTAGTRYARVEEQKQQIIAKEEKSAIPTERVAKVIWQIAGSKKPKPRYLVTRNNLLFRALFNVPDSWLDRFFASAFKDDGKEIKSVL